MVWATIVPVVLPLAPCALQGTAACPGPLPRVPSAPSARSEATATLQPASHFVRLVHMVFSPAESASRKRVPPVPRGFSAQMLVPLYPSRVQSVRSLVCNITYRHISYKFLSFQLIW